MPEEIRVFVPVAIQAISEQLAPRLCSATEASVTRIVDLNPLIYRRIVAGEAFDIGLTNPVYVRSLATDGHIDVASHRRFGSIPLALGRRKRCPARGDIRRREGVAAILRAAKSIAYVGAGTSGHTYLKALDRLQLAETVGPKSIAMARGTIFPAVLAGQVELIAAPLTTLLAHPDLEPAVVLPRALGTHIELTVFLRARPPQRARVIIEWLVSPDLDAELACAGILRA